VFVWLLQAVVTLKASRAKAQRRAAAAAREKAEEEAALCALAEHARDHHSHQSHHGGGSSIGSGHASHGHQRSIIHASSSSSSSSLHGGSLGEDSSASSHNNHKSNSQKSGSKSGRKSRNGADKPRQSSQVHTVDVNAGMQQTQVHEEEHSVPNGVSHDEGSPSHGEMHSANLAETRPLSAADETTDTPLEIVPRFPSITAPPPPSTTRAANGSNSSGNGGSNGNVGRPVATTGARRGISALFGSGGAERTAANYAEQVRRATGSFDHSNKALSAP